MSDEKLTREDLFLLMESYKNMIESNLTLMEKQDNILNKINSNCDALIKVSNTLESGFNSIGDIIKAVTNHQANCAKNQLLYHEGIKDILSNDKVESVKIHFGQNIKFFGLLALLCSIILGLVALIHKIWPFTSGLITK